MSATLATSSDPAELVAGDPSAAGRIAEDLRVRGIVLDTLAMSLASIDPGMAWQSAAGDALRPTVMRLAQNLADGSGAHFRASAAMSTYADQARTARLIAARAVETWQFAQQASTRALAEHRLVVRRAEHQAQVAGRVFTEPVFVDPGEAYRGEAVSLLASAQSADAQAAEEAAASVQAAANEASDGPGFWDQAGEVWSDVWRGAADLGVDIANGAASFGNALAHHPDLAVELIGGLLMMQGGALMEAGGVALDLTVIGAPAGIALNITGAGVITAGAGLAGQAAVRAGLEAIGDDAIRPFEGTSTSGGGGYRSPDAAPENYPTAVNGYRGHAVERLEQRGIERWKVEDLIENPPSEPVWQPTQQTWLYKGNGLKVAVNENGEVVSAFPTP